MPLALVINFRIAAIAHESELLVASVQWLPAVDRRPPQSQVIGQAVAGLASRKELPRFPGR